jgi:hypothetical protein
MLARASAQLLAWLAVLLGVGFLCAFLFFLILVMLQTTETGASAQDIGILAAFLIPGLVSLFFGVHLICYMAGVDTVSQTREQEKSNKTVERELQRPSPV